MYVEILIQTALVKSVTSVLLLSLIVLCLCLGNSASQLQKKITEQHAEESANRHIRYYTDCKAFNRSIRRGLVEAELDLPPKNTPVPSYQWFQAVYAEDVLLRLDEVKAAITSTFGRVLKMDSTKKVTSTK